MRNGNCSGRFTGAHAQPVVQRRRGPDPCRETWNSRRRRSCFWWAVSWMTNLIHKQCRSTDIRHFTNGGQGNKHCVLQNAHRHTLTRSFSALWHSDAHVTHCAHFSTFTVQGGIETSFHQVIRRSLAMPKCDGDLCHFHELTLLRLVSLPFTSA